MRLYELVALAAGTAACTTHQVVSTDMGPCALTTVEVAEDDDSLGFTADDALETLPELLPNDIVWSGFTAGQTEASLSWDVGERAGAPEIVIETVASGQPEELCQSEPALRLRLTLGVSLADGAVTGSGPVVVDFLALTADTVTPFADTGSSSRLEVSLASPYAEELDAYMASSDGPARELEHVYFVANGTLAEAVVDLEADYGPEGLEAIWRGAWSQLED